MKRLGSLGERLAADFLQKKGYHILATNYRMRGGEIDIIAREKDALCFIEVKLRTGSSCGSAVESIPEFKKSRISQAALWYLAAEGLHDQQARFDVVAIRYAGSEKPDIVLIKNAFDFMP